MGTRRQVASEVEEWLSSDDVEGVIYIRSKEIAKKIPYDGTCKRVVGRVMSEYAQGKESHPDVEIDKWSSNRGSVWQIRER
jgi:hypothetical protein